MYSNLPQDTRDNSICNVPTLFLPVLLLHLLFYWNFLSSRNFDQGKEVPKAVYFGTKVSGAPSGPNPISENVYKMGICTGTVNAGSESTRVQVALHPDGPH